MLNCYSQDEFVGSNIYGFVVFLFVPHTVGLLNYFYQRSEFKIFKIIGIGSFQKI